MTVAPENNVDKYIATAPKEMQDALKDLRSIIQKAVPKATERTDYFNIPGYSYDQYEYYNGMFAWFSFKKLYVRIHILPSVIQNHKNELSKYTITKSIISMKASDKIPKLLIKKLVVESSNEMKRLSNIKKVK